jgi:Zn-dependent protease with chaperone function
MGRSWRGVAGALVGTWFGLPLALVTAMLGAVVLGLIGFFGGLFGGREWVPAAVADLPLAGAALDAFLLRSGGVVGGLLGVLLGLVLGFLGGLLLLWGRGLLDDPVAGAGAIIGVAAAGLLLGTLYTLYRVGCEPVLLRLSGARRLSRRERELVGPIVQGTAHRLRLRNYPPVLIDDSPEPSAIAYTRHLVLSRGLLERLDYHPEAIAGVVAHELVHWRNSDPVAAMFVRGVALPLYLVHAAAGALIQRLRHPLVPAVLWLLLWPVLLTVRFVILPLQAADARRAELRADQGAVLAGHRDGLRRALTRLGQFEAGRNGWTRSANALHPALELRLERLEDPARRYPLPDRDGAALPDRAPVPGPRSAPVSGPPVPGPPVTGPPR